MVEENVISAVGLGRTDCLVWANCKNHGGYGLVNNGDGRLVPVHRMAWEMANGRPIATGMDIDHVCWNRACYNPLHLRELSRRANTANRKGKADGAYSTKSTGVRRHGSKFRAQIQFGKKNRHIGLFATEEEAALAYSACAAIIEGL